VTDWTFTCSTSCGTNGGTSPAYGNVRTATPAGLTATAFADTGNTISRTVNGVSVSQGRVLETAYLSWWNDSQGNVPPTGGLGVTNRDKCTNCGDANEGSTSNGEHGLDNNERWDAILFSFTDAINLTEVGLSWYTNDADISVFAYEPGQLNGTPYDTTLTAPNLADGSTTYAGNVTGLIAKGWELVGNYADLQDRADRTALLGTDKVSSYWLVMAYNAAFSSGGCNKPPTDSTATCTNGGSSTYDYMKISLVAGQTPPSNGTPEPGSVVLFGTFLAGLVWVRRKKAAK
jgi:hypothetical protein